MTLELVILYLPRVCVAWLRHELEQNPRHPQFIQTVHGLGYKFAD